MGRYRITVTVKDEHGAADSKSVTITVTKKGGGGSPGNHAPVLDPIGNKVMRVGQTLRIALSAADADGDVMYAACRAKPAGATFDDKTGTFVWSLKAGDEGRHRITFVVKDARGARDRERIVVVVQR